MRSRIPTILRELAVVVGCMVSAATAWAGNADMPQRLRFSLVHPAVPRYYEMVGLAVPPGGPLAGRLLLPDIDPPAALTLQPSADRDLWQQPLPWASAARETVGKKPATYSLSNNWTAQLSYHHSVLAQTLSNAELRTKNLTDFSTDRERDVLGLHMDWRVAGSSTIGLGYRFQSMRGEPGSGISGIGDRFMHAFTLGFTKEWGAADPSEP